MSRTFKILIIVIIVGFALLHFGYWKVDAWTMTGPGTELEAITNELLEQNGFENGVEQPSQESIGEDSVG